MYAYFAHRLRSAHDRLSSDASAARRLQRLAIATLVAFATTTITPGTIAAADKANVAPQRAVLLVHGGCGVLSRQEMTPELEQQYHAGLAAALRAGHAALQKDGATSLDGVAAAITMLEDSPLFNAGKGSVFTREGKNELDASIMDGRTGQAGAVASVTTIKNPILAARCVMEKSGHVLMTADGAEQFAKSCGIELVDPSYFRTEARWRQYQNGLREEQEREQRRKTSRLGPESPHGETTAFHRRPENRFGTVGAVALDRAGNIAAGTSTGGLSMKRHGRVGDSPIIGAGNYADNGSCAISSTGDGEFFLRAVAAHEISALVKYKGLSLAAAADEVINGTIKRAGGDGAVIVINTRGEFTLCFNTEGMYRGYVTADGQIRTLIYRE